MRDVGCDCGLRGLCTRRFPPQGGLPEYRERTTIYTTQGVRTVYRPGTNTYGEGVSVCLLLENASISS